MKSCTMCGYIAILFLCGFFYCLYLCQTPQVFDLVRYTREQHAIVWVIALSNLGVSLFFSELWFNEKRRQYHETTRNH